MAGDLIQRGHVATEVENHWAKMHKDQGIHLPAKDAQMSVTLEEWLKRAAWTEQGYVLMAAM